VVILVDSNMYCETTPPDISFTSRHTHTHKQRDELVNRRTQYELVEQQYLSWHATIPICAGVTGVVSKTASIRTAIIFL